MAKHCAECGSSLDDEARFCVECGAAVPEGTAEQEAAPPEAPPGPPDPPVEEVVPAGAPLTVRVPGWLALDWFGAVAYAFLALVVGLVIQYVLGVFLILLQWVPEGGTIEWGETLRAPLTFFLAFHGPLDGVGVWLMAALWIWIAFRVAGKFLAPERLIAPDAKPSRWAAFVAKVGLVYVVPVTVLAAVLDPEPSALTNSGVGLGSGFRDPHLADWNVAVTFFLGLILALTVAALVLARRSGKSVLQLFGLSRSFSWPPIMGAAWAGARRTLLITLPLLLTLVVVGSLLELAGDDLTFRMWLWALLLLVYSGVLLAGADIAVFFSILSMRFFIGDDFVAAGGRPAWMWVGVAIVVLGFLLGGLHAAERLKPGTAGQAALAGLLVGPMVGVMLFVAAWFVIGVPDKAIVGPALGLPLLWALVAAAGGLLHANRQGLVSGLQFEVSAPSAPAEPE